MKKDTKKAFLLGAGAVALYGFVTGKGVFNYPRFYNQHKAIKNYMQTYYPDAVFGDIIKTKTGWASIIKTDDKQILLNLEKAEDGSYIFSETEL